MGHVGVAYTVRVRVLGKSDEYRRFGNFDDLGTTYLLDMISQFLNGAFAVNSADNLKTVACSASTAVEPELRLLTTHGLSGVGMDLLREGGAKDRIHPGDATSVICGALFNLPRDQTLGFLGVHINNNRHIKGMMIDALTEHFKSRFPTLRLEIKSCVNAGILASAISRDAVESVHLVKFERPTDRANRDTDKWVAGSVPARLELIVNPRGTGNRIQTALLRRYLNNPDAFHEIISFDDIDFDEAKVEVQLPDGRFRIVNLGNPEGGNASRIDLPEVEETDDGDPMTESIFAGLRAMLNDVQGDPEP